MDLSLEHPWKAWGWISFTDDGRQTFSKDVQYEKAPEGIKKLRFGSLILDASEEVNPFFGTFVPGWFFIYKDQDGLAENCHWFGQKGGDEAHE